jgi:tetratricopeptide (TPR) repeat protein
VYTSLGTVEQRLGDLEKAWKRFQKALDLRPNDIAALQGIAGVLFARQDWNNLLNVYNNIIYHAQEPGEVLDAYLTKGFVLDAKLHLPDKAEQHYQKSLALNPAQPTALLRLAELALRRQDWPEAASLADRGLSLDSGTPTVRAGLLLVKAVAHKAAGDERQATEAYRGALAADPSIATELGKELGSHRVAHEALTARLQARV